jgi:uncharacterized protein
MRLNPAVGLFEGKGSGLLRPDPFPLFIPPCASPQLPADLERPVIELLADGEGRWKRRGGEPVPELDGCIDVDISATPFTNTLPIRRLGLHPGESADVDVAYVRLPEPLVGAESQLYGCLEARADGGIYRLEALPSGFTAELPVEAEGLVIDYPGLF